MLVLLCLVVAALGIACSRIASPRGWASPIEGEDVLLVSHRDKLYTLDPDTLIDTRLFPPQPNDDDIDAVALYGDPAIWGDRVFIPTYDDKLYAINLEGDQVWSAPFKADGELIGGVIFVPDAGDEASDDPAGTVYFGSDDGNLYALEADAGILEWFYETGEGIWSTPVISEGLLYVTSLDGSLYVLDAATGALQWQFETDAAIASTPVVNEGAGLVYVGGFDGVLRAIDIDSHMERWSIEAGNWFWTTPLVVEGVVYAGALDNKVYAVDAANGAAIWSAPFETEEPVRAAPIVAGGILIVVDNGGNVYGIDPETGRDAFSGPLVLDDDVLADPLLRVVQSDGESIESVLIMTTGGDLVEVDPETLREIDTVALGD